jgi:hypothetical protein
MVTTGCNNAIPDRTGCEPIQSQAQLRKVAALAAEPEQAGHWASCFQEILEDCVSIPALSRCQTDPQTGLADYFGLRVGEQDSQALAHALSRLLVQKKSVALDLGSCADRVDVSAAQLVQHIAVAVAHRGVCFELDALVLDADCGGVDLETTLRELLSQATVGRYLVVRISDLFFERMRSADEQERTAAHRRWHSLLAMMRQHPQVNLVLSDCTAAVSPIARHEKTNTVCPGLHQMLPAGGAQLIIDIHLDKLVTRHRMIDRRRLKRVLELCVRMADNLIDRVVWPLPEIEADAYRCRRIALHLTRIGDLVRELGLCAGDFETLESIDRILQFSRHCVYQYSVQLARERGAYPALGVEKLSADCHCPRLRDRVLENVTRHGTRHSRLIAIGPYDLIPGDAEGTEITHSINLLPVLRYADSLAFRPTLPLRQIPERVLDRLLRLTGSYWRTAQAEPSHWPL